MKNIGLVLCGGGAKGAYQVGAFKALEELELLDEVKIISSASIGALNGALFLMYSPDEIRHIWESCRWDSILGVSKHNLKRVNQIINGINTKRLSPFWGAINMMGVANQTSLPLNRNGFDKVLNQYLNPEVIKEQPIDLRVSCRNLTRQRIEYFQLKDQTFNEMKKILYATSAVPRLYHPVLINQNYYCDPMKYEPIPLAPILKSNCETIIIVGLSPHQRLLQKKLKGKKVIEIFPSRHLGTGVYGSFDFRKSILKQYIDLGGDDTYRILYKN